MPMARDVDPAADPDAVMLQDVVEKPRQRPGARWPASDARMEAIDMRAGLVPPPRRVGRMSLSDSFRNPKMSKAGRLRKLSIVGVHRIGNDEVRLARDFHPIGKFVVVGVGIVEKPALLHQQPASVFARAVAAIPTKGRSPVVLAIDSIARAMRSRSSSSLKRKCSSHRQPWQQTS